MVAGAAPEPKAVLKISDFRLPDHLGEEHALSDFADREVVVVAFLGTECPLSKLCAGQLQKIADDYAQRSVAVLAVMPNVQDSLADIATFVRKHNISYLVLKDRRNDIATKFTATRTPQVFVLDRQRVVRYQGRIDDQYLVGIMRDKPTREDARLAIDELLAGTGVSVPVTDSPGCIIGRVHQPNVDSLVTYSRDIAPILQARCVECHRAGEIAPFGLTSYDEAAGWGEMIGEVVRQKRMPPWHANRQYGAFANDRSMPDVEKRQIYEWVRNGCPAGDLAVLPKSRDFRSGWQLPREPDQVFTMQEPFTVPSSGGPSGVPYQRFRVPTDFVEDKWIEAAEIQPGNRSVVHHSIVFVEPPGAQGRPDWIFLCAYVPGLRLNALPEGSAKRVPAGSTFIFEMHYTPNGVVQQDATKVGLLYADANRVDKEVITAEIGDNDFVIPPGASSHVVTATSRPTTQNVTLLSLSPHMHLRGKAFRYELVQPSGAREVLLDVPAYDFNWQTSYVLTKPRQLPTGSAIYCRAVFDNSEANPANPDSTKSVRWGDQTWEEMMLGFFDVILPRDDARRAGKKPIKTGLDIVGMFDAADADHNGDLSETEASAHELVKQHFVEIDQNHDQILQLGELLGAMRKLSGHK
jgi:peroxiredoxin